jgi:hypothetical protein
MYTNSKRDNRSKLTMGKEGAGVTSKLGRRAAVTKLIREFFHDLIMQVPAGPNRMSHLGQLDCEKSTAFRSDMAKLAIRPYVFAADTLRHIMDGTVGRVRQVGLEDYRTAERTMRLTKELLAILETPDEDEVQAALLAQIGERLRKVIEPATSARTPVLHQDAHLEAFNERIAVLVDQAREGTRDRDAVLTMIVVELTLLLSTLRVDRNAYEEIPEAAEDVLGLLDKVAPPEAS